MKSLFPLVLMILFFASCQKDQTHEEVVEQSTSSTFLISENNVVSAEGNSRSVKCLQIRLSSDVYIGTYADVLEIQSTLIDGVSLMNPSSCENIFNSTDTPSWDGDVQVNFHHNCLDFPICSQYEMWLEPTTVVCYTCPGWIMPLCDAAGTNLSMVVNSNGNSHLGYVPMGSGQIIVLNINLDMILNPWYLC